MYGVGVWSRCMEYEYGVGVRSRSMESEYGVGVAISSRYRSRSNNTRIVHVTAILEEI